MRHLADLKNATLAEFDEEEAEWRETAERQVENIDSELEDNLPAPEELDELDADEALGIVERTAEANALLFTNAEADLRTWEQIAIARIRARAKAKVTA
jgi:hypothetical protein